MAEQEDPKLKSSHGYNQVKSHIPINNPEHDPKPGRTDFSQLNVEKRPHQRRQGGQRWGQELNGPMRLSMRRRETGGIERGKKQTLSPDILDMGNPRREAESPHLPLKT